MALSKTMRYYKSAKGKASYRKKLNADNARQKANKSESRAYRAKHKRLRERAVRNGKNVKGKDVSKQADGSYKLQPVKVNRGKRGEGARKRKRST